MKAHTQEEELIALKLRTLEDEAASKMPNSNPQALTEWFVKYALQNTLQSVPRASHLQAVHSILERKGQLDALFKDEKNVCTLLERAREIYDLAYVHEQHVVCTSGTGRDSREIVARLEKQFGEFIDRAQDIDSVLFTQNLYLFISLKQAFPKQASELLSSPQFRRQREQVAKCYQFVLKPLFEKKNLSRYYTRLYSLASWLVLMGESRPDLVYDLAKKINSYVIYSRGETSIEMINVCNTIFDLLCIKFPRETGLKHQNLAALLFRLGEGARMGVFLGFWLQARRNFLDTIDFQHLFRVLSQLGVSQLVVSLLINIWNYMIERRKYSVILHIFSGFIRKEFTRLAMKTTDELTQYFKIVKHFMIGLSNRERFEGEEIDELTNNICEHALKKGISISTCYKHIIEIYSTYENRFSCLSDTSKRFFSEVQTLSKIKLQTADIHNLYDQYIIREVGLDEGDGWESLRKTSNRYRGLENLGNTCYMNAFMQALYMTKKFRMLIHQFTQDGSLSSDKAKLYALQFLFDELTRKEFQSLEPHKPEYFRYELPEPFRSSSTQQDAAEFGRIYLQELAKQLQGAYLQKLQKLLGQKLTKIIRCQHCKSVKKQEESVFDLILTLEQGEPEIYISRLIQKYFAPESFTGQNRIDCEKCKDRTEAISQLIPHKFSDILVLTLSIFSYQGEGKKILLPMAFQFTLNLAALLGNPELGEYQLYAFIVHMGSQQGSGHYLCYARNLQESPMVWYSLNDGYVQQLQISKPQDFGFGQMQSPYMLFYSKKSVGAARGGKA